MNPALALVVLTEDAGASGWAPVARCVRAVCDLLIANIQWERVQVIPRSETPEAVLRAVGANRWKGTDGLGHSLRIQLARYIASELLARDGEARFVFFHIDADQRWSDGPLSASENVAKFDKLVRASVRQQLSARLQQIGRARELDALMGRLHTLVPCWCIESWLYQNTQRARSLCEARGCAATHHQHYAAWAADRALLDDVASPKDRRDLHCLTDSDKDALANGMPAMEMRAVGRSFSSAIDEVAEDGALLHGLIATGVAAR